MPSLFLPSGRSARWTAMLGAILSVLAAATVAGAQTVKVTGTVRDQTGAAVSGADVRLQCGSFSAVETSDANGVFSFVRLPCTSGVIRVRAPGFALLEKQWSATENGTAELEIVLALASMSDRLIVTAARTSSRIGDTPGAPVQLDANDLQTTSALTLDDALRQVPGFSLFRRSGSRTTNPTTMGVSLRGLGASGASRALVLVDGMPLNDPFGAWVFWDRVPRASVDAVEIVPGGASSLYGSEALGGVVQILTRNAEQTGLLLETSYGNRNTPDLSLWTGGKLGAWSGSLALEAFSTDGYILVPASIRGPVDTRAASDHDTLNAHLGRRIGQRGNFFVEGLFFEESRRNGTPLQSNGTQIGRLAAGVTSPIANAGDFSFRIYADAESYDQSFSAVAANRKTESLTDLQRVPAQRLGGSVQWSRSAGSRQTLVAGTDGEEIIGATHERMFAAAKPSALVLAGGSQRVFAGFGEDILRLRKNWIVTAGLRFDHWSNFDASSIRKPLAPPGPPAVTPFADRTESAWSPRLSTLYQLRPGLSFTASFYRAFRAPTLNELYRSFRVGNVLTQSNAALRAERLTGGEAGASWSVLDRRLETRGTFFWSEIGDPVANVTISTTPALITRQRQNLGRTQSRGAELDVVGHPLRRLEVWGSYLFTDATVISFPANHALVGLWVPQVPHHELTFAMRYTIPSRWMFSLQGRFVGVQFDDDQNQFPLDHFTAVDALGSRSFGHGVELFGALENMFNVRYAIGRTPTPTLGPPIYARFGLRLRLPAR